MTRTLDAADAAASLAPSRARLYRTAGVGGILAFVLWLLQPLLVSLLAAEEDGRPTWELHQASPYLGAYEAVTFGGVAVGLLLMTTAVRRLAGEGVAVRIGGILGTVAGVCFLVVGGLSLGAFTSVGLFLPETVPAAPEQEAVYEALALVITGVLCTFGLAMIGWLATLATAARRAGVVGLPTAIVAGVAAIAGLLPLALPFQPPWGLLAPLAFSLVFGIVCLVKARKA